MSKDIHDESIGLYKCNKILPPSDLEELKENSV